MTTQPSAGVRPLRVLRSGAGWVLLATVACVAGAWFVAQAMTASYLSQASIILESRVSANTTPVAPAMGTEKQIVNSGVIVDSAAGVLGLSSETLKKRLDVSVPPDANILNIACHAASPEEATRCARVVAGFYIDYRNGVTGPARSTTTPSTIKATLVTDAALPSMPESNRRPVVLAAGLVLGLALGVGTAFLRDLISPRLRGLEDFAARAGLPVLTVVPRVVRWRAGYAIEKAAQSAPDSSATEAFRYLRARLTGLTPSGLRGNVILVTSAVHGEGRSSVVANLATVVARSGLSVLVVDADSVRPAQHRIFGLDRSAGFAETLVDGSRLGPLMQSTTVPDLRVLASGTATAATVDLLASSRLGELFAQLRAAADVVIVDAGPLLQVSDAAELAPHSDIVLLVADAKRSSRGELAVALRQLTAPGAVLAGVLNDMPSGWGERPAAGRERGRFAARRATAVVEAAAAVPAALIGTATDGPPANGRSASRPAEREPEPVIPRVLVRQKTTGAPNTANLPILSGPEADRRHGGRALGGHEAG